MSTLIDDINDKPDLHSSSSEYAKRFIGPVGQWFLSVQGRVFLSLLGEGGKRSLLDVGGGHGQVVGLASGAGFDVTVLGSGNCFSESTRELFEKGGCSFRVGSLLDLPFSDRQFEVVACFRQISHITDWRRLIAELCRVSSSTVIIDYPPLRSFNLFLPGLFFLKKKIERNTRRFTIFSDREVLRVFGENGFKLEKRIAQFFIPMGLHRLINMVGISVFLERVMASIGLVRFFGSPVIVKMVRKDV